MDAFVDLDVVGALQGSDKSSSYRFAWDYLRHYEALFAEYRAAPINMLEIGIGKGPSLRMWRWFFAHAEITGIDVNPDCLQYAGPRVTVEIGSQIDPDFLDRVCARAPPTIILDDGSHIYEHMIFSFEHLLPKLAPGGIYVVEDITRHSGPSAPLRQSGTKPNVPEYFLDIARRCFARDMVPPAQNVPDALVHMVDRVTFIGHAVALHKRDPARDVARGVATADAYLAAHEAGADMHENFAEWVLRHDGPNDRAVAALRHAMADGHATVKRRLLRAETLLRTGETEPARVILDEVAGARPGNHQVLLYLATLQMRLGDRQAARSTRDAAYAGPPMNRDMRHRFEQLISEEAE
jgi:trans-aconitate methyltransferase